MKLLPVVWVCTFLAGCYTWKPVQFIRTENFSVSGTKQSPAVAFGIVFHNPNSFGCTVTALESEGSFNNQVVFNAGIGAKVHAISNRDFIFPVTAQLAKM